MNLSRLEKNLTDNIKEAQLKLGYDGRPMSLNYMQSSLNNLAACDCTDEILLKFAEYAAPHLGTLTFRKIKDGICITVPSDGTAYVNSLSHGYEFISDLIQKVSSHGISMDDVTALFRRYSAGAAIEEGSGEDFDLLVYFPDGQPDEYLYCLTAEPCMGGGCHVIYHRFIREDYEEIFG